MKNVKSGWSEKFGGILIPWDRRSIYFDEDFVHEFIRGEWNFSSFVALGDLNPANNRLTRMIAGNVGRYEKSPWGESDFSTYLLQVGTDKQKKREMLETAKRHLRQFGLVGITSRMGETLSLVEFLLKIPKLDWESAPKFGSPVKPSLTQEEIKLVLEFNDLDSELYEYAEEIFEKMLAEVEQCKKSVQTVGN